ncbi:MAG: type III pantothenate kinase [Candidatus Dormibacteria bacterium]
MLLALDVGNTNIVVGVFEAEQLVADFRIHTDERATGDELGLTLTDLLGRRRLGSQDIDGLIVANVVPALTRAVEEAALTYFGRPPMMVGPGIRTGVRILSYDPRQVGADRVANALAAYRAHGGPAIIVDFGTSTNFDVVGAEGEYLGGAIAPGLEVSLEALVSRAARLSRVELIVPDSAIGRATAASMQVGLVLGHIAMIEGLVARMRAELGGTARTIGTGGLAATIAAHTTAIDVVDERLTLTGLRLIHEINR